MEYFDEEDAASPGRVRRWIEDVLDATGTSTRAAVLGVAGVLVVGSAFWWLSAASPVPVDASLPLVDPASVTVPTTSVHADPVVVHVAGAVQRPGVLVLAPGARWVDAVEAAGGLTEDADDDRINLAGLAQDGSQLYVPRKGEVASAGGAPADPDTAVADGIVDLNRASAAELETLPGIGPATAAAIVDHRTRHGPFASVEELLQVRGIGEAKLAALRDRVRT